MSLASPCINICRMSPASGLCEGCFRSLDEIARWSRCDEAQKRHILELVARRRTEQGASAGAIPISPEGA